MGEPHLENEKNYVFINGRAASISRNMRRTLRTVHDRKEPLRSLMVDEELTVKFPVLVLSGISLQPRSN